MAVDDLNNYDIESHVSTVSALSLSMSAYSSAIALSTVAFRRSADVVLSMVSGLSFCESVSMWDGSPHVDEASEVLVDLARQGNEADFKTFLRMQNPEITDDELEDAWEGTCRRVKSFAWSDGKK